MRKSLLILLLIGCMISCDEKEEKSIDPNVVSYPMTVGSQWTYDRKIIIDHLESENSDKVVATDTFKFVVNVWIDKDTVLNVKEVKVFKAREVGGMHTSCNYYFLDSEGLKTYAYLSGGLNVFAQAGVHLKSATDKTLLEDNRIFYENPPTLDVKLPLTAGSRWTYRHSAENNNSLIDKEVTGGETLKLIGQNFDCYKVSFIFNVEPQKSNTLMTEWISDKGLIRRISTHKKVLFTKEDGQTVGYGRSSETLTLKALEIQ